MDKAHGIIGIYLHGSRAEGIHHRDSDYDISIVTSDGGKLDIKQESAIDMIKPRVNIHNIDRARVMIPLYDPFNLVTRFRKEMEGKLPHRVEAIIKLSEQLDSEGVSPEGKIKRELEKSVCMIMGTSDISEAKRKYENEYYERRGRLKNIFARALGIRPKTPFPVKI